MNAGVLHSLPKRSRVPAPSIVRLLLLVTLFSGGAACVTTESRSQESILETRQTVPVVRVYVVIHEWHSGIVLPRAALTPVSLPEAADFPAADYLEFGWGDRDFYQGKRGPWVVLKAAFWPSPGVLHVASCTREVAVCYPDSRILWLDVPESNLRRLIDRLSSSFQRGGQSRARSLGPGLYGESRFYPSHEKFYLLKTCNTWTARLLRAAGYPLHPASSLTAGALMSQLKPYAKAVEPVR